MSKGYVSMALIQKLGVNILGIEKLLPLKDHADGMIGVIPVFKSKKAAEDYASEREILVIELSEPTKKGA